jgi:hypothetical protein
MPTTEMKGKPERPQTEALPSAVAKTLPKAFRKGKKSFVSKIIDAPRKLSLGTFGAFPYDVKFANQDSNEDVVLVVRQSPAIFWMQYLAIIIVISSPLMFFAVLNTLNVETGSSIALGLSGSLIAILIAISIAVDTFMKWYYSVNIITTQRIVDVNFVSVMYHRFSETQLEKIEDVSHKVGGILGSLFDFGHVFLQTAAANPEFEFENVPRPRDIQDTILDLLEMKQKGEI